MLTGEMKIEPLHLQQGSFNARTLPALPVVNILLSGRKVISVPDVNLKSGGVSGKKITGHRPKTG